PLEDNKCRTWLDDICMHTSIVLPANIPEEVLKMHHARRVGRWILRELLEDLRIVEHMPAGVSGHGNQVNGSVEIITMRAWHFRRSNQCNLLGCGTGGSLSLI